MERSLEVVIVSVCLSYLRWNNDTVCFRQGSVGMGEGGDCFVTHWKGHPGCRVMVANRQISYTTTLIVNQNFVIRHGVI